MTELLPLIDRLASRAAEAVLGRARIANTPLRQQLRAMLTRPAGAADSLLASPVLEAAFGYRTADTTMAGLAESGLFTDRTVAALAETAPLDPAERAERNTMPLDRAPYTHQLAAWRALAESPPRSVLVSSGTGSGKTEAFLVPIFDALAREAEARGRLVGVQALLLYPLNALIASQRDRLADWTAPFGGDLRFCLYNGLTPEEVQAGARARTPHEVLDRKTLRAEPPPVLVTNATMLEYLLVRPQDAPILAASRGRLRYVVLDEAHSYIGSQAAEMTLLLRRALLAFGVRPEQVSFIATSATLGDGPEIERRLRRFLADLSGVPPERVDVITGTRHVPALDPRAGGLAADADARALREHLARAPASLATLGASLGADRLPTLLERLMAPPENGAEPFLPLRLHLFHRAQGGLWACPDGACPGRAGTPLDDPAWPFGPIYTRDRECCAAPGCGTKLFPVMLCDDCGQPVLEAALGDDRRRLARDVRARPVETFDNEPAEDEGDDDEAATAPSARVLVLPGGWAVHSAAGRKSLRMERATGALPDRPGPDALALLALPDNFCPCCGAGARRNRKLFRYPRTGGAFATINAGRVLLEAARPAAINQRLPFDGRQLITFADSRQGTARFAASWQSDAERDFARGCILHRLHEPTGGDTTALDRDIAGLEEALARGPNPALQAMLDRSRAERAAIGGPRPVSWADMRARLATLIGEQPELRQYWRDRDAEFESDETLAELLLYTEFLRRPVVANSLETLGLAALRFPTIEALSESALPDLLREHGATLDDWKDYLTLLTSVFLRANSAVDLRDTLANWVGQRVRKRPYLHRRVAHDPHPWERRWPFLAGAGGRFSRPVLLLRDGLGVDLADPAIREAVNEALDAAWTQLYKLSNPSLADSGLLLDLRKAEIVAPEHAYLCPVTRRLFDRGFGGITPYLTPTPRPAEQLRLERLAMPRLPYPWRRHPDGRDASAGMRARLAADPAIAELRRRGLWTDIGDRLALLAPFARIVEHSAQQPPDRLRGFERAFKGGRINVLCCSTTMEMGVDIGGIGTVAMANVPPSPANYRQRVGRAGRRRERLSIGFTYCPDTPLGWHAFDQPEALLTAPIDPPLVALDSAALARRHANALLLSRFLLSAGINMTKFEAGAFFAPALAEQAPARRFLAWLRAGAASDTALADDLGTLLAGTALAGIGGHAEACADEIDERDQAWREEHAQFVADHAAATGGAQRFLSLQIKRMEGEYLLSELVRAAFLPGHGFPADVVPFVTPPPRREPGTHEDWPVARRFPTRPLEVALAEYAPGNELVIDGVVYRSGGVTLNWKRPANEAGAREVQAIRFLWHCRRCGATGDARHRPALCPGCGADAPHSVRTLRPAGFLADAEKPPGNAIDFLERVPAMEPFLAAATPWISLSDPALGRFRHDPQGLVITLSRGVGQHGYALCLRCGRAEPETAEPAGNPRLPASMEQHWPLRPSGNSRRRCDAAPDSFAIQRHLALGHSRQTHVFALHLPGLSPGGIAQSVAIAMREALCRRLGVARDELAWFAERAPEGTGAVVWLFDTAAGGAGYAGAAARDLPALLEATRAALVCTNPGCTSGCPACLVLRDTAHLADRLDRSAALNWLTELLPRITLPEAARLFGPGIEQTMEQAPLFAAICERLAAEPACGLTLTLPGAIEGRGEAEWWALPLLDQVAREGREVTLLVPRPLAAANDYETALGLRMLARRGGGRMRLAALAGAPVPVGLLATVNGAAGCIAWAGAEPTFVPPETIIRARLAAPPRAGATIDAEARVAALRPNTWSRGIGTELDGSVETFGQRFWQVLRQGGADGALRVGALVRVSYCDRYLFSPLAWLLLHAVLLALRRGDAATATPVPLAIETLEDRADAHPGTPRAVGHDWRDGATRAKVADLMMRQAGFALTLASRPRHALAHGRMLRIEGTQGAVRLQLDQGFGYWRATPPDSFDFTARAEDQARALSASRFRVTGANRNGTEVFVLPG